MRCLAVLLGFFLALAPTLDAIPTRNAAGYLEIPRGIATTMAYDSALRVATANSTGSDPEDKLTRTLGYNERNQVTSIAEAGLNGSTTVTRSFDGYGATDSESVSVGGTTHSGFKGVRHKLLT